MEKRLHGGNMKIKLTKKESDIIYSLLLATCAGMEKYSVGGYITHDDFAYYMSEKSFLKLSKILGKFQD